MAESTSSGSKKDMVPINVRDAFGKDPFFSSTWDEFDQMRSDMMSRNKQFWSKVDDDFANFDDTGKSLSQALIFASTNPHYDYSFFIELQVQYMKIPSSNLGRTCCVQKLFLTFRTIFVHNLFSSCSAKRTASDKDLSVTTYFSLCFLQGKVYVNSRLIR